MVPLIFMKEFAGLEPAPPEGDVVSFARFIITSYMFGASQIPDLIHDFIATLRQKTSMSVTAKLHAYSVDQLMKVMVEDLQPSAAAWILTHSLGQLSKGDELPLLSIVKLGVKYPILFYVVERFRKHVKRLVFGDRFWAARTYLKCKISEMEGNASYYGERFRDERTALVETSRSIIADVVTSHKRHNAYRLTEREVSSVMYLDEEGLQRLKDMFGYERSRQLIVDSEIGLDCESKFVESAFGAEGPVARPPRGLAVFPGGHPREILEIESEEEDEDVEVGEEGEGADGYGEADLAYGEDDAGASRPQTVDKQDERASVQEGSVQDGSVQEGSVGMAPRSSSSVRASPIPRRSGTASPPRGTAGSHSSWHGSTEGDRRAHSPDGRSSPTHAHASHAGKVETILDPQMGREFRFDPETGKSSWVYRVVDQDGDVLLEACS